MPAAAFLPAPLSLINHKRRAAALPHPRYWDVRLDLLHHPDRANSVRKHGVIYVKRKAGQLPYKQSPKVLAALLAQSDDGLSAQGPGAGTSVGSVKDEEPPCGFGGGVRLARSLDADPVASQFSTYLCSRTGSDLLELASPLIFVFLFLLLPFIYLLSFCRCAGSAASAFCSQADRVDRVDCAGLYY